MDRDKSGSQETRELVFGELTVTFHDKALGPGPCRQTSASLAFSCSLKTLIKLFWSEG